MNAPQDRTVLLVVLVDVGVLVFRSRRMRVLRVLAIRVDACVALHTLALQRISTNWTGPPEKELTWCP